MDPFFNLNSDLSTRIYFKSGSILLENIDIKIRIELKSFLISAHDIVEDYSQEH